MKKTALSIIAASFVASSLVASTITLYQDQDTGAIYTKPGYNRVELGDFISAKDVYIQNQKMKTEMSKSLKGTTVKAGVATLKFSGEHYIEYHYKDYDDNNPNGKKSLSEFHTTRNYLQVKAYWNKKDYMRVTLDTKQVNGTVDDSSWVVRLKYGYFYLSDILPYTGVEIGQAHTPWLDYAEHHGFLFRPAFPTFVDHLGLIASSAPGINFKTKTDYFSSEIGLFNDSGYHHKKSGTGQSFDWRLTAHVLGTGDTHNTNEEWLNISYFGRYLTGTDTGNSKNTLNGIHAVYNNPMFLIGGYWVKNDQTDNTNATGSKDGDGWSINGELRPIDNWSLFARYDDWNPTLKDDNGKDYDHKTTLGGVAYKYNKHVKFIATVINDDPNDNVDNDDLTEYKLDAQVKW